MQVSKCEFHSCNWVTAGCISRLLQETFKEPPGAEQGTSQGVQVQQIDQAWLPRKGTELQFQELPVLIALGISQSQGWMHRGSAA